MLLVVLAQITTASCYQSYEWQVRDASLTGQLYVWGFSLYL